MKTNKNDLINQKTIYSESEYSSRTEVVSCGLTKREYFAAMAMQGILSNPFKMTSDKIVSDSVECADALIEELNKDKNDTNKS